MDVGRRAHDGTRRRPVLVAVIVCAMAFAFLTASTSVTAVVSADPSPGAYTGSGFDACTAPPADVMSAWIGASPYRAIGIYIGGVNRACSQRELTAAWVSAQQSIGWQLVPIYLGLQPYCTTSNKTHRFTAANSAASGRAAADEAVGQARLLGLGTGSTIFNDIEAYSVSDLVCRQAVLTFQSAWTARLHDYGFLSGFYSSLGSGVADQVAAYESTAYVRPDYLWFARYDGAAVVTDPTIPSTYWLHRRIKQYRTPTSQPPIGGETYGGKSVFVDRDQFDVAPVPPTPFGDFNGNGWSDLITRDAAGSLYRYPGNGTRFGSRAVIGSGWNSMNAITRLGDFNRDGREDIIARERVSGALWLYPSTATGFARRLRLNGEVWNNRREITAVGDLTGDGFPDLLAVQISTGKLILYPGRGTTLGPGRLLGGGWNTMSELTGVGDFNRDGRGDILARHAATGDLWLYKGARGALGVRVRVATGWNGKRDLTGVGDFDRDGFTDLLAVDSATGQLFRYPGRGTSFGTRLLVGGGWAVLRPLL